jgi:hypothetical protein
MSSREVANIVDLSQSKVNRIRKKYFENIVMARRGRPEVLIIWEKRYVVRLVTIGGLILAIEAIRELKNASGFDLCVEIVRYALRKAGLESTEKVSKPTLSTKNVKKRLEFAKMYKDWTIYDWKRVVFSDEIIINCLCLMELVGVGFVIERTFQCMLSNRQ